MKNKMKEKMITKRETDFSAWYLDVIEAAVLADNSPVRGCMVIRPYGYSIWENIQRILDGRFKETGVENAYFPLFIPMSFLTREAEHVEGFAKECAIVTHHRLEMNEATGRLEPAGELEEPLIVRPTSETIMYAQYAKWIQSYRDLPLLINQWANVVRWEMRTRMFLRTMEFLWQEGHTAHATREEADAETLQMLEVYRKFAEETLAIPVVAGRKSESEKFAGADYTTSIEAMMQDGKALQAGTSHQLGQNFAKPFGVKYLDCDGNEQFVWQTSWGLSTRIIGALIMTHSDDRGLVLPPKIAPIHVVIIPVWTSEADRAEVMPVVDSVAKELRSNAGLAVKVDNRDMRPGPKFFEWEKKGVPIRIEIGPKDVAKGSVVLARRDTGVKVFVPTGEVGIKVPVLLDEIQQTLFERAKAYRQARTSSVNSWVEFKSVLEEKGGFLMAHWCVSAECEAKIKEETKATTRCIPFNQQKESGECVYCGAPSSGRVIFARAY